MILHHYGFASSNIIHSAKQFEIIGYKQRDAGFIIDPVQNVRLLFLEKDKTPLLELVEPLSDNSPVSKILLKNGSTLYHTCYEVDSIEETKNDLRKKGFVVVVNPLPATAFNGRLICFLYSRFTGLIELLEKEYEKLHF
jgi:methylmalonyl-CoA/ethylmalonyl-CoA epimerase